MEDIYKFHKFITMDGMLTVLMQTGLLNTEVEIELRIKPVKTYPPNATPEDLGWPPGFFEQTYGILADDPMELPDNSEDYEAERDAIL